MLLELLKQVGIIISPSLCTNVICVLEIEEQMLENSTSAPIIRSILKPLTIKILFWMAAYVFTFLQVPLKIKFSSTWPRILRDDVPAVSILLLSNAGKNFNFPLVVFWSCWKSLSLANECDAPLSRNPWIFWPRMVVSRYFPPPPEDFPLIWIIWPGGSVLEHWKTPGRSLHCFWHLQ